MEPRLGEAALAKALEALPGWTLQEGRLCREYRFRDFGEAFAFMARVAQVAQQKDHHPDWSNSNRTVRIALVTHEAGGITGLDVDMARAISALAVIASP